MSWKKVEEKLLKVFSVLRVDYVLLRNIRHVM
jgi:hypothetical protein